MKYFVPLAVSSTAWFLRSVGRRDSGGAEPGLAPVHYASRGGEPAGLRAPFRRSSIGTLVPFSGAGSNGKLERSRPPLDFAELPACRFAGLPGGSIANAVAGEPDQGAAQ